MRAIRVISIALIALVATASLAACSEDKSQEESTAASAEEWANGICGDVNTWVNELSEIADRLVGSGITDEASLDEALADTKAATQKLGDEFDNAPAPDIEGGDQAKQAADEFEQTASKTLDDIDQQARELEDADGVSGFLSGLAAIAESVQSLITSARDLSSTLEALDIEYELRTAVENAPNCQKLTSGSSD